MIQAIAFTVYPVSDMARARQFYENILGLTPAESFGEFWQEYDLAGNTFGIVLMNENTPDCYKNTRGTTIAFEVEDLAKAIEKMQNNNVPIVYGPENYPSCSMFVIADPDNNIIALHQLAPDRK